jgi:CRISPR-associated protein Cas1
MTDRIIDITETSVFLKIHNHLLVIEKPDGSKYSLPTSDIAAIVISNRAVALTHAVLAEITNSGGIIVVCDDKYLPAGMMLPMQQHYIQTERFRQQANAPQPTTKRIWQQLIRAKIFNQAKLLNIITGSDHGLFVLSQKVKSGDPENIEARAAKIYWQHLFQNIPDFKRERFGDNCNPMLNYGYAVLRATTARAICGVGLHPTIGVNHHNRYNPFCLADDLMEPFRPLVDRAVVNIINLTDSIPEQLDKTTKAALINALLVRVLLNDEAVTLFDALTRSASSIALAFENNSKNIIIPEEIFCNWKLDDEEQGFKT